MRQLIELRHDLQDMGFRVGLELRDDGLLVFGPSYNDRLMAVSELKKRRLKVSGHEQRAAPAFK